METPCFRRCRGTAGVQYNALPSSDALYCKRVESSTVFLYWIGMAGHSLDQPAAKGIAVWWSVIEKRGGDLKRSRVTMMSVLRNRLRGLMGHTR